MTEEELRTKLEVIRTEGLASVEAASDLKALEEAQVRVLGRKAPISEVRSALGRLDEEERRRIGKLANEVTETIQGAIETKRATFADAERAERFENERVDVTLPGEPFVVGGIHPVTAITWRVVDIFVGLGYRVADGPEVELARYNFDALNTPAEHPSRSPIDTYFIADTNYDVCLRTQTSPVQARVMELQQPPIYVVAPGRVYRRETLDATHSNVFHQIEGLAVDEGITMADLKGSLELFAHELFGEDLAVRLRPHFFPFTEPSAELDVQCFVCRGSGEPCRVCKAEGWIEVLGCGMVHPALLEYADIDPERYTGFAFGMGLDRLAMLTNGINDIRYLWDNDMRFLHSLGGME
jgi:phenylalanyl-tRNA synthetase alpha chain